MNKILVTGSTGLLGSTIVPQLKNYGHRIVTQSHKKNSDNKGDLINPKYADSLIEKEKPDIIINCVGLTSVEMCQNNINLAYQLNCRSVENLVNSCLKNKKNIHLIHISTDHLYDGIGPHKEFNISIQNNYAFSKYAGELFASKMSSTILRTNFVGMSQVKERESMTDWVFNNLKSNKPINVFDDVLFNPLSMNTLGNIIDILISKKPVGLFNLGSNNGMSKADFDFLFAKKCNLNISNMTRMSADDVVFDMAYRPKDMRMDLMKIEKELSIKLPELSDELNDISILYCK